jgi:hypothetical protein
MSLRSIYPNPAKNTFRFSSISNESFSIIITNLSGQILLNQEGLQSGQDIDITNLQAGMYIVSVLQDDAKRNIKLLKN